MNQLTRYSFLVLADIDTKGDLGRVVNAMQTTKKFKDARDEIRLVFDGAGPVIVLLNAATKEMMSCPQKSGRRS